MSNDMKHTLDGIKFNSPPSKRVRHNVTCLFDLPDEILLLICHYLSTTDILSACHTPSNPDYRLHRVSLDTFKKITLDGLSKNEYIYLSNLFSDCENPLRPKSFILSNEYVTCLVNYYFTSTSKDIIQSMFMNLKSLTLLECTIRNLQYLNEYINYLTQLQYLHIIIQKPSTSDDLISLKPCNRLIGQFLFNDKLSSIHTIRYDIYNGLSLRNLLISHKNLRHVHLVLTTMNDLYLLLHGRIPNVERLIIELSHPRSFSHDYSRRIPSICAHLIDFTLLESSLEFDINGMKYILAHMRVYPGLIPFFVPL